MTTNKLLQHFKGNEVLVSRLQEAINRYQKNGVNIALDFYGIDQQKVIKSYLTSQVPYELFGGYQEATNCRLVIGEDIDWSRYLACLKAQYNTKYLSIGHRDVLGTIYSLKIDINRFGDLWVNDNCIYLYVAKEIENTIINDLTRIAKSEVHFGECEFISQKREYQNIKIHTNSLRLDKIVSALIHKSREKTQQFVKSSNVFVNDKVIEDCDYLCNNCDILSIRGFGRFKVGEIELNQKTGHFNILILKFI